MKKFIFYCLEADSSGGEFFIVTTKEGFELMEVRDILPKEKISGVNVNIPDVERIMQEREILRLIHNEKEWIITKI